MIRSHEECFANQYRSLAMADDEGMLPFRKSRQKSACYSSQRIFANGKRARGLARW